MPNPFEGLLDFPEDNTDSLDFTGNTDPDDNNDNNDDNPEQNELPKVEDHSYEFDEFEEPDEPEQPENMPEEASKPEPEIPAAPVKEPERDRERDAHFAEQRRQKQFDERLRQTPEYELAEALKGIYGKDTNTLLTEIKEAALQRESKAKNIPVEDLRERQALQDRLAANEQTMAEMQFNMWQTRIEGETATIKAQHPYLTDDDLKAAKEYMIATVKDINMPLGQAVYAVHGDKITASMRESLKNEVLAEISGRSNNSPKTPTQSRSSDKPTLSEEERLMARKLGVSEANYLKNKSN